MSESYVAVATALLALVALADHSQAGSIAVPNGSFESPTTPYVSINIDSWQKTPKPDWYTENPMDIGSLWINRTGAFKNQNDATHIDNCDGNQAIWLFAVPEVGLFQDYESIGGTNTVPTHEFDATFQAGKAYRLQVGLLVGRNAGAPMLEGVTLALSFYYRDAFSNRIAVATTTVTNDYTVFTNGNHLLDYEVNVPAVQPTDAWAGQNIGILFLSTVSSNLQGGYWDLDNVRLTEISPPVLSSPVLTNNQFQFLLESEPGLAFEILADTNAASPVSNWTSLGTLTNATGTIPFVDTTAIFDQRYYQVRQLP